MKNFKGKLRNIMNKMKKNLMINKLTKISKISIKHIKNIIKPKDNHKEKRKNINQMMEIIIK